jgi:hypothetical protein
MKMSRRIWTHKKGRARGPALSELRDGLDYQTPPALQPPFPPLVHVRVDVPSAAVRMAKDVPLCDTPVTV